MNKYESTALGILLCLGLTGFSDSADAARKRMTQAEKDACIRRFHIDVSRTDSTGWHEPDAGSCKVQIKDGHRFPDPGCTPGGLNLSVTEAVLRSSGFRTECIRDQATSAGEKRKVYEWYGVEQDPTCEMDHFIPLTIGGADTLDNIWPQCGPRGTKGKARDYVQKDDVEAYLGRQIKNKKMDQSDAREKIAEDWVALMDDVEKDRAARHAKAKGKGKSKSKAKRKRKSKTGARAQWRQEGFRANLYALRHGTAVVPHLGGGLADRINVSYFTQATGGRS